MTKARAEQLCEYSVDMAVSAIEIYNKPGFTNREAAFCILMCAAWEGLAKARILQVNKNKIQSLWVKEKRKYKKTRHEDRLTIDGFKAVEQTITSSEVVKNINKLMQLRNHCGLPSVSFTTTRSCDELSGSLKSTAARNERGGQRDGGHKTLRYDHTFGIRKT